MTRNRDPSEAAKWLACTLNVGLVAGAICLVAAEGWDLNRDGAFTVHEALLVLVRLLAFPVYVLLQLTPVPLLQILGVPDAPWPSSAAVAIALGLPLWGFLVCGVLVVEAWLGMAWESAQRHKHGSDTSRAAERPPGP